MRKILGVLAVGGALAMLVGSAAAHWGGGPGSGKGGGMGPGYGHGHGTMGGAAGCPGWTATTGSEITDEKAKKLAQDYANRYLTGFKVERLLPFAGMHHKMYSVELKNDKGELRTIHINPFGNVMPFGGPWTRGS